MGYGNNERGALDSLTRVKSSAATAIVAAGMGVQCKQELHKPAATTTTTKGGNKGSGMHDMLLRHSSNPARSDMADKRFKLPGIESGNG